MAPKASEIVRELREIKNEFANILKDVEELKQSQNQVINSVIEDLPKIIKSIEKIEDTE